MGHWIRRNNMKSVKFTDKRKCPTCKLCKYEQKTSGDCGKTQAKAIVNAMCLLAAPKELPAPKL